MIFVLVGVALILLDYFLLTFLLFPVGLGLIVVGVLKQLGVNDLLAWLMFSLSVVGGYIFSFHLKRKLKLEDKISDFPEVKGKIGKVTGKEGNYYKVRFDDGLLGETTWLALPKNDGKLNEGDKVVVEELKGNVLVVSKLRD